VAAAGLVDSAEDDRAAVARPAAGRRIWDLAIQ
jgi:hypothetical protein